MTAPEAPELLGRPDEMPGLERRYRSVLRALPASYRAIWEEEMVVTFLDGMLPEDAEEADFVATYGRPGWGEIASILGLGVRLRLGNIGGPPRYLARNAAVRVAALAGLLTLAVLGVVEVLFQVAAAGLLPWLHTDAAFLPMPLPAHPVRIVWEFSGLLWTVAFLAVVLGRWRAARLVAAVALALSVAHVLTATLDLTGTEHAARFSPGMFGALLVEVLVLAALGSFHPGTRPVRRLPWLHALVAGIDLGVLLLILAWRFPDRLPVLDWVGLLCLVLVAAVLLPGATLRSPRWSYALALLAPVVLAQRLLSMADVLGLDPGPGQPAWLVAGLLEAAAVLGCGVLAATRTARALRALPVPPDPVAAWSTSDR